MSLLPKVGGQSPAITAGFSEIGRLHGQNAECVDRPTVGSVAYVAPDRDAIGEFEHLLDELESHPIWTELSGPVT
jgi:hypothetical protein